MSNGVQGGTGSAPSASASPNGKSGLWAAVIVGVVLGGIAIYFLGFGGLSPLQSVAIFVAAILALLFAFLLALWLVMGSPSLPQCDGLKSCVAWLLALGGGGLVVFILVWVMLKFTGADSASSIVGLPLIVVVGVVVLLVVIGLVTFTFSVLGLASNNQALGLPDGSVRSIIALMLLVLFSILSIYLYNSVASGKADPAAADIAKQLIVLLGTLVTAVSSFYFGSNAVASAHAAARGQPDGGQDGQDGGQPRPGQG